MIKRHQLQVGAPIRLSEIPTSGKEYLPDRDQAEDEFKDLRHEIIEWQRKLYAEHRQKLLIVLQAMDAGGKDSTIRKVFRGINPQGVLVTSFKEPTPEELDHDFLWRIHRKVPGKGMIGIFNRSHYEDVLVVRVHQLVQESVWRPRFQYINDFEKRLADTGTTILKFYLHISKDEQKERFEDRLKEPDKNWKFSYGDLEKRKLWQKYMEAYEEALYRCTTSYASWYVIPADQKWYRNLAISQIIVDTFKKMNPQYPQPSKEELRLNQNITIE